MISFVSLSPWFSTLLGHCRPRTVSTSKVLAFIFSDKPPFHIRAFVPRSDAPAPAPAPEPVGPVSLLYPLVISWMCAAYNVVGTYAAFALRNAALTIW